MPVSRSLKRRFFLKEVAYGTAGLFFAPAIVSSAVLGLNGQTPPSDKIVMGMIGVGSMGMGHVRSFLGHRDVHISAVCDVRKQHRDQAKKMINEKYGSSDCQVYHDFREMLSRKDIDAVMIAVPDHWHALIGIEAALKGKHMYYEKPLSMSVTESKAIRTAVQRSGVVFQFGTQQRSDSRFRFACELVRNGKIGQLESIMIGSANYKQIPNQSVQPIPDGFDYDRWLGPAPWAPYTFERCTRNWTLIYDYSLGCLSGAWGIHHVDIAQWANNADNTGPIEVEGWGIYPKEGFYDTAIAFEIEHTYANGTKLFHMDMPTALKRSPLFKIHWMGMLFNGSEGWIFVCRELIKTHPGSLLKMTFNSSDIRLPSSRDHRRDFLNAVKNLKTNISTIDIATHSDMVCHQADISMRLRRKLYWNPEQERFKNDEEANRLLNRPMRSPWHI
jgi:hypothetical protein